MESMRPLCEAAQSMLTVVGSTMRNNVQTHISSDADTYIGLLGSCAEVYAHHRSRMHLHPVLSHTGQRASYTRGHAQPEE